MAQNGEFLCGENRTDLALEAGERLQNENAVPKGLRVETLHAGQAGAEVTRVYVESEEAARRMSKPMGVYITIEAPSLVEDDKGYHRQISALLCSQIRALLPARKGQKARKEQKAQKEQNMRKEQKMRKGREEILVVGLGNRAVTADALGPRTIDHLAVNRHLLALYGEKDDACGGRDYADGGKESVCGDREECLCGGGGDCVTVLCAIEPGVMAKTGIETADVVASITARLKPDAVLVLDSLAAGSVSRLYKTIQISNTGIAPGSGVGNHRNAINQETLGVPVIAVGIPMVVDAATIVRDAFGDAGRLDDRLRKFQNMYVTTKEIDEMTERLSFTLSEAINALGG